MSEEIKKHSEVLLHIDGIEARESFAVDDQYGGVVFVLERATSPVWQCEGIRACMQEAGYYFIDDKVYAPDAQRLMSACETNGIPIEINTDMSSLNGPRLTAGGVYGGTLLEGKHPVGIGMVGPYLHDIGLEHLPILAILKEQFFEYLSPNGVEGVDVNTIAGVYDHATKLINSSLYPLFTRQEDRYDKTLEAFSGYLSSFTGEAIDTELLKQKIQAGIQALG